MTCHTITVGELEAVMARGWWPLEHAWLGSWLLRASAGFTGRGNSALPLGDPGRPVESAIAEVEDFYRARRLRPRFAVPSPDVGEVDAGGLARTLQRRGYDVVTPTAVMTADAAAVAQTDGTRASLTDRPDAGWLRLYRYRGQELPPRAVDLLTSSPYQRFASVVDDGRTVAVGRLAIARGWGGITAMEVAETHRGRGLARAVLATLAQHAADRQAEHLYLQVATENTAARRLYESAGFSDHHGYHYRVSWCPAL
jgi:N-acetylglutamate synthase